MFFLHSRNGSCGIFVVFIVTQKPRPLVLPHEYIICVYRYIYIYIHIYICMYYYIQVTNYDHSNLLRYSDV